MSSSASVPLEGAGDTAPLNSCSHAESTAIGVGQVVAGKYLVEHVVRAGGMGVVLAARHLQLGERVALKVLHGSHAKVAGAVARFLREARAAARVKSEHVVRSLDFGTLESGAPYLVMEFLEGRDLRMLLDERGPLPVSETVDYLIQAARGLEAAHALRIVHRDLKPSNLFLTQTPRGRAQIKILDFGIAKALEPLASGAYDGTLTSGSELLGSPAYMSPEQIRAASQVDERSDIWSLGVICYELLTGHLPFEGQTLSALLAAIAADAPIPLERYRPDVPEALSALVDDCLRKNPAERIGNVADLLECLCDIKKLTFAEGLRTASRSSLATPHPPAVPVKRLPVWLAFAGIGVLVGLFSIHLSSRVQDEAPELPSAGHQSGVHQDNAKAHEPSSHEPSTVRPSGPVAQSLLPPKVNAAPETGTSPVKKAVPNRSERKRSSLAVQNAIAPKAPKQPEPVSRSNPPESPQSSAEADAIARRK